MVSIKIGKIETYINQRLHKVKALHFTLIDPSEMDLETAKNVAKSAKEADTDGFLVRPSYGTSPLLIKNILKAIKSVVDIPVLSLPTNVDGLTSEIDALLFITLLNSNNTYWMIGAQALGAPVLKQMGIETIPTAYIIVEPGSTTSWMGDVKPIPRDNYKLAAIHALGGEYFGMRFLYIETGEKIKIPVPAEMIQTISKTSNINIIVQSSNATSDYFKSLVDAGAKILVTPYREDLKDVIEKIRI
ncbi:MAG: phosphoglycerol geranylgeranyltransferase [DPANN group archaeon]|nr:phosphoglycerol geranylgeranyltransferase [DPANN group archaeon]